MHVFGNFVLKRSHHMLSLASIMKTFICALLIRSGHHLTVLLSVNVQLLVPPF